MINETIDGEKLAFMNEERRAYYFKLKKEHEAMFDSPKKRSGRVRQRVLRKREAALKFHFEMVLKGRSSSWIHIEKIHKDAPATTLKVAGSMGVTELKFLNCNGESKS